MSAPHDTQNTPTVFYYSRERRLSKASPEVQQMNEDPQGGSKRHGIFRSLFSTRSNGMIMICIILIVVMILISLRHTSARQDLTLGGNTLHLLAINEGEESLLAIIKEKPSRGSAYMGAVEVTVSPVAASQEGASNLDLPPVMSQRIIFGSSANEGFQILFPFTAAEIFVTFRTSDEQKSFRLKVQEPD